MVSRAARALDIASLVLIIAGGALYLRSYFGMEQLRQRRPAEFVRGETVLWGGLYEHARLNRMANVGLAVSGVGVIVGLSAAAYAKRKRGRRS